MPYRLFPSDRFAFRRPAALLRVRIVVAQAEPRGLGARVVADGVVHAAARAEERRGPCADGARVRRERAVGAPGAPVAARKAAASLAGVGHPVATLARRTGLVPRRRRGAVRARPLPLRDAVGRHVVGGARVCVHNLVPARRQRVRLVARGVSRQRRRERSRDARVHEALRPAVAEREQVREHGDLRGKSGYRGAARRNREATRRSLVLRTQTHVVLDGREHRLARVDREVLGPRERERRDAQEPRYRGKRLVVPGRGLDRVLVVVRDGRKVLEPALHVSALADDPLEESRERAVRRQRDARRLDRVDLRRVARVRAAAQLR
mmetsp:Transcript_17879/g.55741  ORF Transcript_17879/g.55741 Transcript_17879/m.55741 type:complete len:322 (+) Transcript_17879:82-1047(+)